MSEASDGLGGLEPGGPEVVAVAQSMGQEGLHVGAGQAQGAGEERRGALAVDVVVAVDQDAAAGAHRARDGLHRLRHPGQRVWVRQLGQRRPEEAAGRLFGPVAALDQERGQGRRKPQRRGQRLHLRRVRLGHHRPA